MERKYSLKRFLSIQGMKPALAAFAVLIVIYTAFGIIDTSVFSSANNMNLLRSMSIYLLIGIGQSFVLITGNIDLSIGSTVGLSAMISAALMEHGGISPPYTVLITICCSLLVGLMNGTMVSKLKLPPHIATLGMMFIARGVAYMISRNRCADTISLGIGKEAADRFQDFFYYGKTWGIFNAFLISIAIFAVFFFLLSKTKTGRHMYSVGSNIDAAKLAGVNVQATITRAYLVSAFCACVVGIILCAQSGMGNMEAGNMYEMYGVAAAVIGGISTFGGSGILLGTFAGAAVWQTLQNGLSMVGAQVGIQRIVIGVVVMIAVLLDIVLRDGKRTRHNSHRIS